MRTANYVDKYINIHFHFYITHVYVFRNSKCKPQQNLATEVQPKIVSQAQSSRLQSWEGAVAVGGGRMAVIVGG